jgi:hypothetical protein
VACGYAKLGDIDLALGLLERLLPNVGQEIRMWMKQDSDFDALKSQARYQKILEQIKDA